MEKRPWVRLGLALVFLIIGLTWTSTIYHRCLIIYPEASWQSGGGGATGENLKLTKIRSPHAKFYHAALFYLVVMGELATSFLYVVTSWALWRRFRQMRWWVITTIGADVIFKLGVALYLYFFANPLAALIKNNQNLILNYYLPNQSLVSTLSAYFSGLRMYYPSVSLYLLIFPLYAVCVLWFCQQGLLKEKS